LFPQKRVFIDVTSLYNKYVVDVVETTL